jgi:DNA helicase II / ATP-dependent DNA helicase PcrA
MITQELGKFKIIGYLGGGRFGDVYLAHDTLIDKEVALKVARSRMADRSSFLHEVKTLFSLEHPHILRYYSAEFIEGKLVLITEYIEGQTLRNFIEKKCPTDRETAKSIMLCLADAVDYANERKIIHRDLKPENIMIDKTGSIKIMDFGLAKFVEKDMTQSMGGTPPYMSPESWKGKVSATTDQWSLAAIGLELINGSNVFFADNLEEIRGKIMKPLTASDCFLVHVPQTVKESFLRALSSDPELRFPTCKEFVHTAFRHWYERRSKNSQKSENKDSPLFIPQIKDPELKQIASKKITKEQRQAINSPQKRVLVLGGPGTGKTHTLIEKTNDLIYWERVDPINILVTTFTVKGWQDLEDRLQKSIKTKARDLCIGNFHRICLSIVEDNAKRLGYKPGIDSISYHESLRIFEDLETENDFFGYLPPRELKQSISELKQQKFKPEDIKTSDPHTGYLKTIWEKYQSFLLSQNKMDDDDVLLNFIRLFSQNKDIQKQYHRLYRFVLIDDFHDFTNSELILDILKLLIGDASSVFCTGDDDQNIYEWMSRNGSHSYKLDNYFDNFSVFHLTKSFRLPQEIITPALNLIKNNKNRIDKVFWTQKRPGKGLFEIKEMRNPVEEAATIGAIIKKMNHLEGINWKKFAVLARYKRHLKVFYDVFLKLHIPFSFLDDESFLKSDGIELLIKFLNTVVYYNIGVDAQEVIHNSSLTEKESREILRDLSRREVSLTALSTLRFATDRLKLVSNSDDYIDSFFELVKDFENISENKTPSAFLNYLNVYRQTGLMKKIEKVKFLTIHSAKGLEFPNVFLIGLVEGAFPRISPEAPRGSLEEERRICYVGMTRATERLFLTYPKYRSDTRKKLNRTSRFVKEIIGV